MADREQRSNRIVAAYYLVSTAAFLAVVASQAKSWSDGAYYAGFLLGLGGMGYLFRQWRRGGNLVARSLVLAAFGTWAVAVLVGTGSMAPAFVIACVALAVGLGGAVFVFLSQRRGGGTDPRQDGSAPSAPSATAADHG